MYEYSRTCRWRPNARFWRRAPFACALICELDGSYTRQTARTANNNVEALTLKWARFVALARTATGARSARVTRTPQVRTYMAPNGEAVTAGTDAAHGGFVIGSGQFAKRSSSCRKTRAPPGLRPSARGFQERVLHGAAWRKNDSKTSLLQVFRSSPTVSSSKTSPRHDARAGASVITFTRYRRQWCAGRAVGGSNASIPHQNHLVARE